MNNTTTVVGALIATAIGLLTAFLALLQTEEINGIADIPEAAWWVLLGGAGLIFLKDFQALWTRRALSKLTGTGSE